MNIVVYTTPTCPYCTHAKTFLTQQGARFVEKDVSRDPRAAQEMVRVSGQRGVPVITIDGQPVVGFDQPKLRQLLGQSRSVGSRRTKPGPMLGASIADAASQVRRRPGIPSVGAYVGRVKPDSPAAQAGLRRGDVITRLGGQTVDSADDVHRLVPGLPIGREVSLSYTRKGREIDTLVRLR